MTVEEILEGLNPSQKLAVETLHGPVQINAVAGSGKTRVLTRRIAYMLKNGIKAKNILCTTFTKKASLEMTERLGQLISKMDLLQLTLGTTHSIGYRILSKEYKAMGHHLANAFRHDSDLLINGSLKRFAEDVKKDIMKDMRVQFTVKEQLRDMPLAQLLKVVGSNKNEYIDAHEFESRNAGKGAKTEAYIEFYLRYEQKKWNECRVDADDLLYLMVKLFKERKDILEKYQQMYKFILVDEAQDNNGLQYELIKMLGYPEFNVFVVGDDDQSMYGFRGAKPEEFINFTQNYKGAKQISLEDNYRSNPHILEVANKLIGFNTIRLIKRLKAHKTNDTKCVAYNPYQTEEDEATGVTNEIKILTDQEGYDYKQTAILYRTNAQSRAFEEQLIISGMPYVIYGGISFYERKEVKDIIAYLQLAVDPHDNKAFERVINTPTRYLGKAFMEKVSSDSKSHWDAVHHIFLKDYERRGVESFSKMVDTLSDMVEDNIPPTELVDYILREGEYEKYLKDEGDEEDEGNSRMENISTLKYALSKFEKVQDFLDYIVKMSGASKQDINGVQLMTIHKSKGLEFPVVFVVGCTEGLLPHFKAIEASENGKPLAIEEERRLAYVAVTRAIDKAYVSSIGTFNGKLTLTSRFVHNMELIAEEPKPIEPTVEIPVSGLYTVNKRCPTCGEIVGVTYNTSDEDVWGNECSECKQMNFDTIEEDTEEEDMKDAINGIRKRYNRRI